MESEPVRAQVEATLDALRDILAPGCVLGVYLYGSAALGSLRPDSDLDLFAVTSRPLTDAEKRGLVEKLLPISGRATRPQGWRPIELTNVVQDEVRPWRYPPRLDLQYGEWLREELLSGDPYPWPAISPDLAVLITMVLQGGRPEVGPPPARLLDPVPRGDLVRAMVDSIPELIGDLEPDTRNVLLTLARMWTTVATGEIRSKDGAAEWALTQLPEEHRPVLVRARELYVEGGYGEWDDMPDVRSHAAFVITEIERLAGSPGTHPSI
jgi:predicted nucleotidyltransferase